MARVAIGTTDSAVNTMAAIATTDYASTIVTATVVELTGSVMKT